MDNLINSLGKATGKTADDLRTEAEEALQDDIVAEVIKDVVEALDENLTIENDENEDGKFTYIETDRFITWLQDYINDRYRLEEK